MSCPTCDHTLGGFGRLDGRDTRLFWCERCGTIVGQDVNGEVNYTEVPKLVNRCRQFEMTFPPGNLPSVSYSQEWKRLGIAESINTPKDRPT